MISKDDDLRLVFDFELKLHEQDEKEIGKTTAKEVCKYFLKGTCNKGSSCQFKHIRYAQIVWLIHNYYYNY